MSVCMQNKKAKKKERGKKEKRKEEEEEEEETEAEEGRSFIWFDNKNNAQTIRDGYTSALEYEHTSFSLSLSRQMRCRC